jgi:hypothetical protein
LDASVGARHYTHKAIDYSDAPGVEPERSCLKCTKRPTERECRLRVAKSKDGFSLAAGKCIVCHLRKVPCDFSDDRVAPKEDEGYKEGLRLLHDRQVQYIQCHENRKAARAVSEKRVLKVSVRVRGSSVLTFSIEKSIEGRWRKTQQEG